MEKLLKELFCKHLLNESQEAKYSEKFEICSKLTIKTLDVVPVSLLLNLNIFHAFFYFSIVALKH